MSHLFLNPGGLINPPGRTQERRQARRVFPPSVTLASINDFTENEVSDLKSVVGLKRLAWMVDPTRVVIWCEPRTGVGSSSADEDAGTKRADHVTRPYHSQQPWCRPRKLQGQPRARCISPAASHCREPLQRSDALLFDGQPERILELGSKLCREPSYARATRIRLSVPLISPTSNCNVSNKLAEFADHAR